MVEFAPDSLRAIAFATDLGWMGLLLSEAGVMRLVLGHADVGHALQASMPGTLREAQVVSRPRGQLAELVARLKRYARSGSDSFRDVPVVLGQQTAFQAAVVKACRAIPLGRTRSYGELAEAVHAPRAARAVGNCMRNNPVPLIIPCHRVVGAGGKLGGYSAPQGLTLKRRLLALEQAGASGA